jgi:GAF domain-containing protein
MNTFPVASPRRYFFRFNARDVATAKRDLAAILAPLIEQTRADGVIVYRLEEDCDEFRAVAARTRTSPKIAELGVTLGVEATALLSRGVEPFQAGHSCDERFANLPETLQFGIRRVLVFPLRANDSVLGFMTIGRADTEPFAEHAIQAALPVARVVTAVLERDALRVALKERKLVERAKGLIQKRRGVSEEEAYLILRNQSRRSRRPMAELAEEVINEAAFRKTA